MALRFVTRATPGAKVRKTRIPRKSVILSTAKPRVIKQDFAAIDQFGELGQRKRDAAATARKLGHDLIAWHRRSNDPAGRWNAFCGKCNAMAVVCTEAPDHLPDVYGHALTDECSTSMPL